MPKYQEYINEIKDSLLATIKKVRQIKNFFYYAKKMLLKEETWSFDKDIAVIKNMIIDKVDSYKTKKV